MCFLVSLSLPPLLGIIDFFFLVVGELKYVFSNDFCVMILGL
jgi:hypothetical protein